MKDRKVYIKPSIEQVRLVLEEAVLGTGCKTTESNGSQEPCEIEFVNCVQAGS
jgi:hypothetical protein